MNNALRYFGQGLCYLLFIAFIGYFSHAPSYTHIPSDQALVKFTFTHASKRLHPCIKLTPEELAKRQPQRRFNMKCPRERSPIQVEFDVDGKTIYQAQIEPRSMNRDLPAPVYQRFVLPVGRHHLAVRMNDDVNHEGFNYEAEKTVDLGPLQILIIDFDSTRGEFVFK